jgi:hypothetical protein
MKSPLVEAELFHAEGRTNRETETEWRQTNSRLSQICEKCLKIIIQTRRAFLHLIQDKYEYNVRYGPVSL